MKIIILGAGAVGFQTAEQLIADNKDVVLIEKDPEVAKNVANHLDCMVINDEGNNPKILKKAGIDDADFFISVTNSDEVNMISCAIVSSEFNVPYKIARVRNLDYNTIKSFERDFLGITYFVNPDMEAASEIVDNIEHGVTSNVMSFEQADVQMRNIVVDDKSFFCNKSLQEIKENLKEDFLIACVIRQSDVIIPSGRTVIQENDNIYFVARQKILEKIFIKSGRSAVKVKNVIIVGGGRVGRNSAKYLLRHGRNLKIIDSDYEICKQLADEFPEAIIINSDISDRNIFEEEQLHSYDLIITATKNQELNILAAIYAKTFGIKRAIALVTRRNYLTIASNLGIDSIVSPKRSTVDTILKYIRSGNIKSIHSILTGKAEVIEFDVAGKNSIAGKAVKDTRMPSNSLILAVTRSNRSLIPDGSFVINEGDSVLIISSKECVAEVENLFND